MLFPVTEHLAKTARHASFYLACGPETGPLIVFVHGWPELSHSWRHQLRCFAAFGFRCIAPDMRGYGRSSSYRTHADYALEHSVHDMLDCQRRRENASASRSKNASRAQAFSGHAKLSFPV